MNKEKILKEFEKSVFGDFFAGGTFVDNEKQVMYTSGFKEGFNKAKNMSKQFLSKAINQTREETIREVNSILPEEKKLKEYEKTDPNVLTEANLRNLQVSFENQAISPYVSAFNEILKEIKQSLKSLINK